MFRTAHTDRLPVFKTTIRNKNIPLNDISAQPFTEKFTNLLMKILV